MQYYRSRALCGIGRTSLHRAPRPSATTLRSRLDAASVPLFHKVTLGALSGCYGPLHRAVLPVNCFATGFPFCPQQSFHPIRLSPRLPRPSPPFSSPTDVMAVMRNRRSLREGRQADQERDVRDEGSLWHTYALLGCFGTFLMIKRDKVRRRLHLRSRRHNFGLCPCIMR